MAAIKKKAAARVLLGDCVRLMGKMDPGQFNLIIADSPYNYSQDYDAYEDSKPWAEFMSWTKEWLTAAYRVLHNYGSMWVFAPDEWVSELDVFARHELKLFKRSHVVWFYTFGQAAQKNFSRSHTHILYFTKRKSKFTFNDAVVRVPSNRQLVYNDKRANPKGKMPDNTWLLTMGEMEKVFTRDQDTWLVSRICGTFHERRNHAPNQIPVPLLERIVLACSNPADHVLDPFLGTGSTGEACGRHGRNFTGTDISKKCVQESNARLAAWF